MIKTVTLFSDDNPIAVICPGHVDAKIFNKAFKAEGWSGDPYKDSDMEYVYLLEKQRKKGTSYRRVKATTPGAKPYTWVRWD